MKVLFDKNIREEALKNNTFRKVLVSKSKAHIVAMNLKPKEDLGSFAVENYDQIVINVQGQGICILDGKRGPLNENSLTYIPKGVKHNLVNTGKSDLKLYAIYSPSKFLAS